MKTLPAKKIRSNDIIEIDCGNFGQEEWKWALVIIAEAKEKKFSFFVNVAGHMFWTEDFDETHEFNVLIKDPTIEVSIRG